MGQVYQPGRWQEIEGVPDETSDADMLAAVRSVVRTAAEDPVQEQKPAPGRVQQWQTAEAVQPNQPPRAAAAKDRALMSRLLDRLRA
ncbi:hypothetical protein [Leisingera sp. ANG-M7]|uniref:hypothetical protein n=1 Tax=Leisingera sp. ANG-M7 TaxID=1577902 RepID=UPI00057FE923|nr:hypothetical protein [Leisingera sp. ANG-M7]KIC35243.1 hypothetical protein RA26_18200 [Leisingera sp. ANG-M7]NVK15437.1 hypothetical protein [Paracoccaceae bacterium]